MGSETARGLPSLQGCFEMRELGERHWRHFLSISRTLGSTTGTEEHSQTLLIGLRGWRGTVEGPGASCHVETLLDTWQENRAQGASRFSHQGRGGLSQKPEAGRWRWRCRTSLLDGALRLKADSPGHMGERACLVLFPFLKTWTDRARSTWPRRWPFGTLTIRR